jgi:glycosyltransferase involved in cell wall biosynthesis
MVQVGPKANGGVKSLVSVLENLPNTEITLITQGETEVNERLRALGANVLVWPGFGLASRFSRWADIVYFNLRLIAHLAGNSYDSVHVNDIQFLLRGAGAFRAYGLKPVMNIRSTNEEGRIYGAHWKQVRFCRKIIVLSDHMRDHFIQHLPLPAKLTRKLLIAIYSVVDFSDLSPVSFEEKKDIRARLGIEANQFYCLVAAKVDPVKQQYSFLQEVERNPEAWVGSKYLFVGDVDPAKEYDAGCLSVATSLSGKVDIEFAGFKSNISDYYKATDLTLVISQREGMARCMIESLACGVPVISFAVSSAREILEKNNCGIVIPQGDYDGLTRAVRHLQENPMIRKEMGKNGLTTAHRLFDQKKVVASYAAVHQIEFKE